MSLTQPRRATSPIEVVIPMINHMKVRGAQLLDKPKDSKA